MLVDVRRIHVAELGVSFDLCDVRTPDLRIVRMRSRKGVTDWGLLDRAIPFVYRIAPRSGVTLIMKGAARFEEGARRAHLEAGQIVASDLGKLGTEAYGGAQSVALAIEWDPAVLGAPWRGTFEVDRLQPSTRTRMAHAVARLDDPDRADAVVEILDLLRAHGFPLERVERAKLLDGGGPDLQPLQDALSAALASLHTSPTIEDLISALRWDARRIHRGIAALRARYGVVWSHWRELVRQARLTQALRLLAAPGATTERVALLCGFRSPAGLCHAFDQSGLPSPGTLARAARSDVLERWGEIVHAAGPPGAISS